MITSQIKKIVSDKFFLAESPLKISKNNLIWIDIYSKKLIFLNLLNKKIKIKKFTQQLGFVINKKNNLIIGLQNKIISYCKKTNKVKIVLKLSGKKGLRTNDGCSDEYGNLWFGVLDEKNKNRGGLYCKFRNKDSAIKIFGDINTPNGPVFASKKIFFFNDTSRCITYKCEIKFSKIIQKKFKVFKNNLKPDGMYLDKKKKRLWICLFGDSKIKCYNLRGKFLNSIKLKAKNITNCTMDGYRKNILYITTAYKNIGLNKSKKIYDGCIFEVKNKFI